MTSPAVPIERPTDWRGLASRLAAPVGAVLAIVVMVLSLGFLADPDGPENFLISIYNSLGMSGQAAQLADDGLDPILSKAIIAVVGLTVGIGGIWLVFIGAHSLIELLGPRWLARLVPWVFVGPALLIVGVYLVYPAVGTIVTSFTEGNGFLENYGFVFTDPDMLIALRNNALWLVLATGGSVIIGLVIATLVDRVKAESLAKTFIFLPLAISMAGAAVIWRFVYAWQPPQEAQIGLLNAAWTAFGNEPVPWLQATGVNTFLLIVIMVWLQTGFAMVVLSAAIKGIPSEVIEAARCDGARESQIFFGIIVPMIRGSIIVVATTIAVAVLKVFDIVYVTTGGRFETEVVANRMFNEIFLFRDEGRASALAVILFIAVIPIMWINIRNLRRQGIGQ
jgi:alpha-glucoside transport system permease protein